MYIWACDYSNKTGEGNLGRLFVNKLNSRYSTKVTSPNNSTKNKFLKYKYISPFFGILFCWKQYFQGRRNCYLNYLPLWNFFIFLLLPPRTILGPITGGAKFSNKHNLNIIRNFLFPLFYKISEVIILLRKKKVIFSTDLLKNKLSLSLRKKSTFNFILTAVNIKRKERKMIDFLIYYRKHKNKESYFPLFFVKKLVSKNLNIHVVGDYLKLKGIINHGRIDKKKLNLLLSKTKYSIGSGENIFTLFTIDCINNNVKIFIDNNFNHRINHYKDSFVKIDFQKNLKL